MITSILVKDISFKFQGRLILIAKGRSIKIDLDKQIAYADGYHFDIDPTEYATIH